MGPEEPPTFRAWLVAYVDPLREPPSICEAGIRSQIRLGSRRVRRIDRLRAPSKRRSRWVAVGVPEKAKMPRDVSATLKEAGVTEAKLSRDPCSPRGIATVEAFRRRHRHEALSETSNDAASSQATTVDGVSYFREATPTRLGQPVRRCRAARRAGVELTSGRRGGACEARRSCSADSNSSDGGSR